MEPVTETSEALRQLGPAQGSALRDQLRRQAELVRAVVPECVGMSLSAIQHGVTLTLVATDVDAAGLDAVQYLEGGPCVQSVADDDRQSFHGDDPLDEERWRHFARAGAAAGIHSSLTLPVRRDHDVLGSINLYASTTDAFDGHEDEVAAVFGAWAPGAVRNADLSFSTRRTAREAPEVLREHRVVGVAADLIAREHDIDEDAALARLRASAERAGITEAQFAAYVLEAHGLDDQE